MSNDIRTKAIILHRTNYGEADRILNFLTPEGKISALAKGVRKEKSRLAGSIELFSVADVVIHQGRSELGTLTSAKMLNFFSNIITDLSRLELASAFLKKINRAAEHADIPDYFSILEQSLAGLNHGLSPDLISTWFYLNLAHASGEEINLLYDTNSKRLSPDQQYFWDYTEEALAPNPDGPIGASEIKLARLLLSARLSAVARVDHLDKHLSPLLPLAKKHQ